MAVRHDSKFLRAARAGLPPAEQALAGELTRFVALRVEAAREAQSRLRGHAAAGASQTAIQKELHIFLRECWDALDALGRLVNLCTHRLFPDAKLPGPRMTRQCTFYTVRRALHAHPNAAAHPLGRLLWDETRGNPSPAYRRLSFLYNVAVFVPVPLPEGRRLPEIADLPEELRALIKVEGVEPCDIEQGLEEILGWLGEFADRCYAELSRALAAR